MKRKLLAICLVLSCLMSMTGGLNVSAEGGYNLLGDEEPKPITVLLDGNPLAFDVPPELMSGRTMVPLRVIFEALGATVYWEDATQTVTAVKGDTIVEMSIGKTELKCSGDLIVLDFPAQLVDGRTLVPARAVAESFGMLVNWDNDTRTVTIDTPTEPVQLPPAADKFEAAHRKLKEFILKDGEWDAEDLEYWTGYSLEDGEFRHSYEMEYTADGVTVSFNMKSIDDELELAIRFNEYGYPVCVMLYAYEGKTYQIVGVFEEENAAMAERENTFPYADQELSRQLLKGCFTYTDSFMTQILGMSLAECGITY